MVEDGGFSLRVPAGYDADIEGRQAFISDERGTLIISFAGVDTADSPDEIIDDFLNELGSSGDGEFIKGESDTITVDGLEGIAYEVTGSLFGSPLKGKTFVVEISAFHHLFGLAISNTSRDENRWENHGSEVFDAVLATIEFIESQPPSGDACPISTDETYGYTKENAIRVGNGGDLFNGPAREREYLDNLRGPNGERIAYERQGSLMSGDVILDAYLIQGLSTPVVLYIDMYNFEELRAPVGFTCTGPFNLSH